MEYQTKVKNKNSNQKLISTVPIKEDLPVNNWWICKIMIKDKYKNLKEELINYKILIINLI